MSKWKVYRRKVTGAEMRPYEPGESMVGISISEEDVPLEQGGMVARNPDNHADQWYVGPEYFERHFWRNPFADVDDD